MSTDWARRAKAPPAKPTAAIGHVGWGDAERCRRGGEAAVRGGKHLERHLAEVLGDPEWVDDLLLACGYQPTGEPQFPVSDSAEESDDE